MRSNCATCRRSTSRAYCFDTPISTIFCAGFLPLAICFPFVAAVDRFEVFLRERLERLGRLAYEPSERDPNPEPVIAKFTRIAGQRFIDHRGIFRRVDRHEHVGAVTLRPRSAGRKLELSYMFVSLSSTPS